MEFYRSGGSFTEHALMQGDPAAIPVLFELLNDADPEIRLVAVEGLEKMSMDDLIAARGLYALEQAGRDSDSAVREEVRRILTRKRTILERGKW
jgi:HEAT repeat protein